MFKHVVKNILVYITNKYKKWLNLNLFQLNFNFNFKKGISLNFHNDSNISNQYKFLRRTY